MIISKEITDCSNFTRFNYPNKDEYLFVITVGNFFNLESIPNISGFDINWYEEVLVSIYTDNWFQAREKFTNFDKYRVKNHHLMIWKMPLKEAEKMYSIFMGEENSVIENTIGPCCKCGLADKWNSLGKDNKSYCYQHCFF